MSIACLVIPNRLEDSHAFLARLFSPCCSTDSMHHSKILYNLLFVPMIDGTAEMER